MSLFRFLFCVAMLVLGSLAQAGDAAEPSLVRAEYAFAGAVDRLGIRDGFLQFLAPDAIVFDPQPANGPEVYRRRHPDRTRLSWYPVEAVLAGSGRFGFTTGPWTASWRDGETQQHRYGEYLSVWQRGDDGAWRVVLDAGIGHPAASNVTRLSSDTAAEPVNPSAQSRADNADALRQLDARFSRLAMGSFSGAYQALAADRIRLLREGELPILGKPAAMNSVRTAPAGRIWVTGHSRLAASGDLGFTVGLTFLPDDSYREYPVSAYVHVWQLTADGWRLRVDREQPL